MTSKNLLQIKGPGRSHHFQTPDEEVTRLFPYLPKDGLIWEHACGKGQIVRALEAGGYKVIGTDILAGFDFLQPLCPIPEGVTRIVSNPPYDVKDEWLERCFEVGLPFALLMPVTALGEQKRLRMYRKYGIQLAMPPKRINFGTPTGKKGKAYFYACWFCYRMDLPDQITFLD